MINNFTNISPEEIEDIWNNIIKEHDTYLKQYDVKLPKKGSAKALWLIYLKKYEGESVHKDTISTFVSSIIHHSGKDQQVRHLSSDGWYILNKGDKLSNRDEKIQSGYHMLVTTENPKPNFLFKSLKRAGRISAKNFDQLKVTYGNRCATCGSPEDKPNFLDPNKRTKLEQGHMDPSKRLSLENSIPQCQLCNQVYKDYFKFDEKGRVVAVASITPVIKANPEVIKEIFETLQDNMKNN